MTTNNLEEIAQRLLSEPYGNPDWEQWAAEQAGVAHVHIPLLIDEIQQLRERNAELEQESDDYHADLVRIMEQRNRYHEVVMAHPYCKRCGGCDDMAIADSCHYDASLGHLHNRCLTDDELRERDED